MNPQDLLLKLVIQLRCMNIYYHSCHNIVSRVSFVGDHSLFADFYEKADDDYDSVIERMIGLFGPEVANLQRIMSGVSEYIKRCPSTEAKDNKALFEHGASQEKELQAICDAIMKSGVVSEGTKNLIAQIMDDSEGRIYKIKQRVRA